MPPPTSCARPCRLLRRRCSSWAWPVRRARPPWRPCWQPPCVQPASMPVCTMPVVSRCRSASVWTVPRWTRVCSAWLQRHRQRRSPCRRTPQSWQRPPMPLARPAVHWLWWSCRTPVWQRLCPRCRCAPSPLWAPTASAARWSVWPHWRPGSCARVPSASPHRSSPKRCSVSSSWPQASATVSLWCRTRRTSPSWKRKSLPARWTTAATPCRWPSWAVMQPGMLPWRWNWRWRSAARASTSRTRPFWTVWQR